MSTTAAKRHRRILLVAWLATALLLVAYLFVLLYSDWIGSDTFLTAMKSLNTIYGPYLAVILAYFVTASRNDNTRSGRLPDPQLAFWVAVIGTVAWNLVVVACMTAPLFGSESGIAEAVQSVTDLAGAFSWLVAGSIGYYFGSSR